MSNNNFTQPGANQRTTPSTTPMPQGGYYQQPMQPAPASNNKNILMWVIIGLLSVLIIMVAVFMFVGGSKDEAPEATAAEAEAPAKSTTIKVNDASAPAAAPAAAEAAAPAGLEGSYALSGKVGPARLNMNIRCSGGRISGSERYAKGSGSISLSGSYNSDGSFQMNEYWGGECCGSYSGRISTSGTSASMSGSFVNSKGSSYSFNLSGTRN